jgi:FMN phosphatase YigB (HAD superfamily)
MPSLDPFDAVSLDVGGVLVVPDHGRLRVTLERAGVPFDLARFGPAHYLAMHAVDEALSRAEDFSDYQRRFLVEVSVPAERIDDALAAITPIFETSLWCQTVPGARGALRALADSGVCLAVTSNSDGWVADLLARHEICQVGPGRGVSVEWISDSGALGVAKPDARLFEATAAALGIDAARVVHVGDSVHYDVEGARAAGMQGVHVDPYRLCSHTDHPHITSLEDLLRR